VRVLERCIDMIPNRRAGARRPAERNHPGQPVSGGLARPQAKPMKIKPKDGKPRLRT